MIETAEEAVLVFKAASAALADKECVPSANAEGVSDQAPDPFAAADPRVAAPE